MSMYCIRSEVKRMLQKNCYKLLQYLTPVRVVDASWRTPEEDKKQCLLSGGRFDIS